MQNFTLSTRRPRPAALLALLLLLLSSAAAWAQPSIGSFSPTSGASGSTVTITGSGFTGATSVRFGELSAVFTVNSATQITATVPRAASTQLINVTTGAGFAFSPAEFTVTRSSTLSYALVASNFAGVSGGANAAPAVADLDGDGRLDLLVGRADGTIARYEQTAANSTTFTSLGLLSTGSANLDMGTEATVAIVDLEGNERFNLVLGRGDGTVSEYEQTGVGAATFALVVNNLSGISTTSNTAPGMTDLDGDGRLELLVGKGDGITSHSQQSFENTDQFYRIDTNFNNLQLPGNAAPFCVDLDGNGRLDILFGVSGGNIYRYEQIAIGSYTVSQQASTFNSISAGSNAKPCVTDIDGDGLLDLLVGRADGTIDRYEQGATAAPTVTGFTPTSGPVGTSVTVTGTNLAGVSAVRVNGTAGTITGTPTATSFTFTVGSGSSTGTISVTTPGGSASSTGNFTVTVPNTAPTDISLSNASVAENQPLNTPVGTFSTTDAQGGTFAYTFAVGGADNGSFNILSGTTLTTNGAFDFETKSSYSIKIRSTDAGGLFFEKTFTITVSDVTETPTITSFTPTSGLVGTSGIVITGTNFSSAGAATVRFNGTTATTATVNSNTQITATVPSGATTGRITVQNADGTGTSSIDFTVTAPVTLATVTTAAPGSVTSSSAVLGGNVTSAGGGTVTERGVVYVAGSGTPTTSNSKVIIGSGPGTFSQTVSGLPGNTLYSVRAYAINGAGTAYGAVQTFTTANNPPTAVDDSYTVNEDSSPTPFTVLANDTDPDAGTALIVTGVTQPAGGIVTFTSAGVSFTPNLNFSGTTTFTYGIADGDGGTDTGTVTVTVTGVNDAPVVTVPATQTTNEDVPFAFSSGNGNAITIADVDAGSGQVEIYLGATQGAVSLSSLTGLTFTAGDGTNDASMTFRGTLANVNAALNNMTFSPNTGYNGAAALQVQANDLGNTGSGGAKSDSKTVAINVTAVNDAPVLTASGGNTAFTAGGGAVAVDGGLTASDTDNATLASGTASITSGFVSAQDVLAFSNTSSATFGNIAGSYASGTGVLTLSSSGATATVAQWQAALRAVTYNNTNATPAGTSRTVSFRVSDGALNSNTVTKTIALTVPAPVVTSLTPSSGPVGTSVTIAGTGFTGATAVRFNGLAAASYVVNSSTQITAVVAAGTTTGPFTVTTPYGVSNNNGTFTVTNASTSTTVSSSVNPSVFGQSVTFTAAVSNTNGSTTPTGTVTFRDGSTTLGTGTISSGAATFSTSALAQGSHAITAVYGGAAGLNASTSAALTQVVNAPPAPAITSLTPSSGPVGTSVTIAGSNLGGASSVSFNGTAQTTITGNTATSLTVTVPAGASTGDVEVTTPSGTSNALTFTVTPPAPVVTSVAAPANATYRLGQNLDFVVSFDQAVTVSTAGGTPFLALMVGSTARTAGYLSGSGTTALTFRYTVVSPDLDTDGVALGGSIGLNGGTIKNATNTNAVLTLNSVAALSGVRVDGVVPTVAVTTTAPSPTSSSAIPVTITFSEPVTGLTAANIVVTNGTKGTLSGSGTTYTLTVTASASGAVTIKANAGAAQDAAGNPNAVSNTLSVTYTPPPVAITSFTPTSGTAGTVFVISGSGFSGATAVTINNVAVASYTVDSNTQITAVVGANTTGLVRVTAPAGTGVSGTNFVVGPVVSNVTVPTTAGTYRAGGVLQFNVVFSQGISVNTTGGVPSLDLTVGSTVRQAVYFTSSTSTAVFRYTIVAGDLDTDGVELGNTINLNGGTIRNSGGADADPDLNNVASTSGLLVDAVAPTVTISSPVGSSTAVSPIPVTFTFSEPVTGFAASEVTVGNGTRGTLSGSGTTYTMNITPAAAGIVTVDLAAAVAKDAANNDNVAAPQLSITYAPAPTISSFTPTTAAVGANITITGNNFIGATAVAFNGLAATSFTVNSATSITAVVPVDVTAGKLSVTTPVGTALSTGNFTPGAAAVIGVAVPANDTYGVGQALDFSVTFDQTLTVNTGGGTPRLSLTVGSTARNVPYVSGSGSRALTFRYVVAAGDLDANGVVLGTSITLSGGTIRNASSNGPTLTLNNVAPTTGVLVDGVAPTVTLTSPAGSSTSVSPIPVTITFSEPVTGLTLAALSVGNGTAGNLAGSGTTYTVEVTPAADGTVTVGLAAASAQDVAGNDNTAASLFSIAYAAPARPTISSLSAGAELPGMPVTLTGSNFTSGSTVSFGGVAAASVTFTSATSLTAVVPAGAAVGSSTITVTTAAGSSSSAPAFEVLKVYDATANCLSTAAYAATGDGAWHYLLAPNGQVVAALQDTRAALGSVSLEFLSTGAAGAVRQDARGRAYLDRNWHLTATNPTFTGSSVNVRFYGLVSEFVRLQAADASVSYATLKATQYSGPNEDCNLGNNNSTTGEARALSLTASTPGNGVAWFVAQAAVADHFSEFYLTGSSTPLPVELSVFTAEVNGRAVRLAWTTASEKNSAHFEIERSLDGRSFERIGEVAAQGNTTSPTGYTFRDSQTPKSPTLVYYRLRQVDADGTATFSPVRAVPVGGAGPLTLYPNPARSAVTVAGLAAGTEVEVLDALGRAVAHATAEADGTARLSLPDGLATGVYVVRGGEQARRLMVE